MMGTLLTGAHHICQHGPGAWRGLTVHATLLSLPHCAHCWCVCACAQSRYKKGKRPSASSAPAASAPASAQQSAGGGLQVLQLGGKPLAPSMLHPVIRKLYPRLAASTTQTGQKLSMAQVGLARTRTRRVPVLGLHLQAIICRSMPSSRCLGRSLGARGVQPTVHTGHAVRQQW